jgi:predicted TIM-barrel fold metal-dependent hydrolase
MARCTATRPRHARRWIGRVAAVVSLGGCAPHARVETPAAASRARPYVDAHTHLESTAGAAYLAAHGAAGEDTSLTARDLVARLDSAGIHDANVLSTAYWFGDRTARDYSAVNEEARVRAENDWVAAQVAQYPDRLIGFCSFNPLSDFALRELARCKANGLRGLKLHLANSRVDLRDSTQARRVREVFAAANAARMPIVVHVRGKVSPYGAPDARVLIETILPAAPDVPIQLAHLAGWGGYDAANDEALGTIIAATRLGLLRRTNLYFDIAAVFSVVQNGKVIGPLVSTWTPTIVRRLREIGLDHVLFGTDGDAAPPLTRFLYEQSGLTAGEVGRLLANRLPAS